MGHWVGLHLGVVTLLLCYSLVSGHPSCVVRTQVCASSDVEQFGFIEIDNVLLSSWSCQDFVVETFHFAYVTKTCKYSKLLQPVSGGNADDYMDNFFDRWQSIPYGSYMIIVSSTNGYGIFREFWTDSLRYSKTSTLLEELGVTFSLDSPLMPLLSTDEDLTGEAYDTCRDTETGEEYRGTISTSSGGNTCQRWDAQAPNSHTETPENFPESGLEDNNYCRNPGGAQDGPYCHTGQLGITFAPCDIPYCNNSDGAAIFARKGYNHESIVKVIADDMGPRLLHYDIEINDKFCTEPLTPLDSIKLDPLIYGQDDTFEKYDTYTEGVELNNRNLHLVKSEPLGCDGSVYGWEFIAANPEDVTHSETYFTIMRSADSDSLGLIEVGNTTINITQSMISDDLHPSYVCVRDYPITVQAGDWYGFYTNDTTNVPARPPVKRVYPPKYTNMQYPCSQQLTWGDAGRVDIMEDLSLGPGYLSFTTSQTIAMNIALKPILQVEFMYTCGCDFDADCKTYGDANLCCVDGKCVCDDDHVYHRQSNKCLLTSAAAGKEAYQSSTLGNLDLNNATQAIDDNYGSSILTGTCAMTEAQSQPWWVVDLGEDTNVYGVKLKTPKPLDVYVELWQLESDYDSNSNPDAVLYEQKYTNLQSDPGIPSIQVVVIHGPFPWRISTLDGSDFYILNRNLEDGATVYRSTGALPENNMGSVGQNVGQISTITGGYLQTLDDSSCWGLVAPNLVEKPLANGQGCGEDITGEPDAFDLYVEETVANSLDYSIKHLSTDLAVLLNSVTVGFKAVIGSATTTFRFYTDEFNRGSQTATDIAGLLDSATGVLISPTNDNTKCLQISADGFVTLDTVCTTKFYLKKKSDDLIPVYYYGFIPWTSASISPPYLPVDLMNSTAQPCYEIVRTTHDGSDVGAAFTSEVNGTNDVNIVVRDSNLGISTTSTTVLIRGNDVVVRHISVGVASEFDGIKFDAQDFTECIHHHGAPINGRDFLLNCGTPLYGRYVALYIPHEYADMKLQLCNVEVLTLPGGVVNPEVALSVICEEDSDCWYLGDNFLICNLELRDDDDKGLCACAKGFTFHEHSKLCIDVDECLVEDVCGHAPYEAVGVVDAECRNTYGYYECWCPYGYEYDGYNCTDIDETLYWNCDCEHECTNYQMDVDHYDYVCSCREGFQLSRNGHTCEDIDECQGPYAQYGYIFNTMYHVVTLLDISNASCEMACAMNLECDCLQYNMLNRSCILGNSCDQLSISDGNSYVLRGPILPDVYILNDYACSSSDIIAPGNATDCLALSDCLLTAGTDDAEYTLRECSPTYMSGQRLHVVRSRGAGQCYVDYADSSPEVHQYRATGCINTHGSYECTCDDGFELGDNSTCENIDECPGRCEGLCVDQNVYESGNEYVCNCSNLPGYTLGPDGYSCIDLDECEEDNYCNYNKSLPTASDLEANSNHSFEFIQGSCVNTVASYHCECPPGYEWNDDEYHCEDIDECEDKDYLHSCEHICNNLYGSYSCDCHKGYELAINHHSCLDINECEGEYSMCGGYIAPGIDHIPGHCENTVGNFTCVCPLGFEWRCDFCGAAAEVYACFDVDECDAGTHFCQHFCINRFDEPLADGIPYECGCFAGYETFDNRTCRDIDECLTSYVCENDTTADCVNQQGSYKCECNTGYEFNDLSSACENIDECEQDNGGCNETCIDLPGSYGCSCPEGYYLGNNNHGCLDIDECEGSPCADNCFNTPGSFYCTCEEGYDAPVGNHSVCEDIEECDDKNGGCMHICNNIIGSFTCDCEEGYVLLADHVTCSLENECANENHGCQQICRDLIDGFECDCTEGNVLHADGKTCVDLNECENNNGGCEHECVDTVGSYFCRCDEGYELSENGRTCLDLNECSLSKGGCAQLCFNSPGSFHCACEGGYQLADDGKKCIGPNFIRLRSKLGLPWVIEYMDTSSSAYLSLKEWIEFNLDNYICNNIQIGGSEVECKVNGQFLEGSVQFDFLAIALNPLSASDQSKLSFELKDAFKTRGNYFTINGTNVDIVVSPQFVYTPTGDNGGSEKLWIIESMCDLYVNTGYCLHDGICTVNDEDTPECDCPEDYEGLRCEVHPENHLASTEIGLIGGVAGLGGIVLILCVLVICLCCRRSPDRYNSMQEGMENLDTMPSGPAVMNAYTGYSANPNRSFSTPNYPYDYTNQGYWAQYPQYEYK